MSDSILLCALDDIPDEGSKGFHVSGRKLFAVKQQGKVYLYQNACPHLGIALEWVEDQFLDSSRSMIQCANHGALFVIGSGKCVSGPCNGQKLKAIAYELRDGDVYLAHESSRI